MRFMAPIIIYDAIFTTMIKTGFRWFIHKMMFYLIP